MPVFNFECVELQDYHVPHYASKGERPDGLLGRTEWKRKGRSVAPHSKRSGEVWDEKFGAVSLYSFDQTKPYTPTPRTLAVDEFWATFVFGHNNGAFIRRLHDEGWKTIGNPQSPEYLRRGNLTKHLSGGATLGVRGGSHTKFGIIDLDLHEGDKAVFLDQFRILLSALHSTSGWHHSVGMAGVHLCQVFPRMSLAVWRYKMRKTLRQLDVKHPDLVQRAQRSGMKTLGELELYPDSARGVRLPLSTGRTTVTDRPLKYVLHRKKQVQDVISYMQWVCAENKAYMPEAEVVCLVNDIVQVRDRKASLSTITPMNNDLYYKHPPIIESHATRLQCHLPTVPLKGRFAQELTAFWNGEQSAIPNIHHAVIQTARMLPYELEDPEDAIDLLHEYVEGLPVLNSQSYSDARERTRQIRSRVQKVYHGDGWLTDVESADRKLAQTASAWHSRGFYISRKETWGQSQRKWQFTEDEAATILRLVPGVLKCDGPTALDAAKRFLGFISRHSGNHVPMTAVPTILKGLPIKWGKHGKAGKFVAVLKGLGWIDQSAHRFVPRGSKGTGEPRRYWISGKMQHRLTAPEKSSSHKSLVLDSQLNYPRSVVSVDEIGSGLLAGNPPTVPLIPAVRQGFDAASSSSLTG